MWDRKVLEKLEDVVGQFSVSCKFRNIEDNLNGLLLVFIVLLWIGRKGYCWRNLRVCIVGGICHGV